MGRSLEEGDEVMPRGGYRSLTIPEGLAKKLEEYVKTHTGYVTITEVVREALREYLKTKLS